MATKKCDVLILMEVFLSLIRCSLISVEPGTKVAVGEHAQRWPKHPTVLCARLGPQMVLQTASRSVAEDGAGVGTRVGSQCGWMAQLLVPQLAVQW
jgi:hypothetical protein